MEQPKRGRGRPKKEKTEEEKPKRPVGRPKKEKTEEKPKRPVGRPKKILIAEGPAAAPTPSVFPVGAETDWVDPEYVKFRNSFKDDESYDRWEERAREESLREGYATRWVHHKGRRYQIHRELRDAPNVWKVYFHKWKDADKGKNPHSAPYNHIGYVGSGEFSDIPFPT
jgi:hypothetical protein